MLDHLNKTFWISLSVLNQRFDWWKSYSFQVKIKNYYALILKNGNFQGEFSFITM